MPTISSGSSQTFTAGVRDATFTVVTNGGTYASVSGADTVSIGPIQTRRTFGPYAVGQSITVSAISGDVLVEYGDATPQEFGPASSVLSGSQVSAGATGVAGVTASGALVGLSGGAPSGDWIAYSATIPAVLLGDSHAGENGPTLSGTTWNCPDVGFLNWLQLFAGQPFQVLANYGVTGERTDQILARVSSATSSAARVVFVTGGANDVAQAVPYATTVANLRSIYDSIRASGKALVIVTLFPTFGGTAATGGLIARIRAWQLAYAAANKSVWVVDGYAALINSASATGAAKTNFLRSDNLHPSPKGARAIGQLGATALSALYASAAPYHVCAEIDRAANDASAVDKVSNPLLSGTVTSGVIASFQVSTVSGTPTATPTVAARTDGFGQDQVDTITTTGSAERQIRTNDTYSTRLTPGSSYVPEVYLTVTGQSAVQRIRMRATATIDGVTYTSVMFSSSGANSSEWDQSDYAGWVRGAPIILPAGASITAGNINVEPFFDGAGGAVVKVGRVSLTPYPLAV